MTSAVCLTNYDSSFHTEFGCYLSDRVDLVESRHVFIYNLHVYISIYIRFRANIEITSINHAVAWNSSVRFVVWKTFSYFIQICWKIENTHFWSSLKFYNWRSISSQIRLQFCKRRDLISVLNSFLNILISYDSKIKGTGVIRRKMQACPIFLLRRI